MNRPHAIIGKGWELSFLGNVNLAAKALADALHREREAKLEIESLRAEGNHDRARALQLGVDISMASAVSVSLAILHGIAESALEQVSDNDFFGSPVDGFVHPVTLMPLFVARDADLQAHELAPDPLDDAEDMG